MSENRANQSGGRKGFFGSDFKTAFLSFHLNRPLLRQRVEDLQACLNYLVSRNDVESNQVQLVALGQCGPVALHLAALDERIGQVQLVRSIQSWTDVVAEPLAVEQLGNVVPFALEYYDLPNLVQSLPPRRAFIDAPVDPTGQAKQ